MDKNNINDLTTLLSITNSLFDDILTSEIVIPMTGETVVVKGIDNKTDIGFKTSYTSYKSFINRLHKMIYSFTKFTDREKRPTFKEYADEISAIDPEILALHIYNLTYDGTLGKQTVSCPCGKNVFEEEIKIEHLVNEESIKYFDKTFKDDDGNIVPMKYKDYEYVIEKEIVIPEDKKSEKNKNVHSITYKLYTGIPSLKKYLMIFDLIPEEEFDDRIKNDKLLDDAEELTISVKKIEIYKNILTDDVDDEGNPIYENELMSSVNGELTDGMQNIFIALKTMSLGVDTMLEEYNKHIKQFIPVFKKEYTCGKTINKGEMCGRNWDNKINPLMLLHLRFQRKL